MAGCFFLDDIIEVSKKEVSENHEITKLFKMVAMGWWGGGVAKSGDITINL